MGTPVDIVPADILSRIVSVRGQRVLFDADLQISFFILMLKSLQT
ncbi:MAG: hypothetical protein WDO72_05360 [Pseudomonadota bacterium]